MRPSARKKGKPANQPGFPAFGRFRPPVIAELFWIHPCRLSQQQWEPSPLHSQS